VTSDELPTPVRELIDAANANDTAAFLACFTADGAVDDWGREFTGADAIRGWSDREFIGVQVHLDVRQVTSAGGETVVEAEVGGSGFNGPSHFSFRVAGDSVERMTIRA
jgi:hypothetical protein